MSGTKKIEHLPNSVLKALEINSAVFTIKRCSNTHTIYLPTNISSVAFISLSKEIAPRLMKDLVTDKTFKTDALILKRYQYLWLTERSMTKNE